MESKDDTIIAAHLSAGGVAPIPLFLKMTSEFLNGKTITAENITEAATISQIEISPITDARGSAEYKSLLLRQLIYAHFVTLFSEIISVKELV